MKTVPPFPPRRILCPVDLSELSALALKYGAAGARAFAAELTVLQAIHLELPPYFTADQADRFRRQDQEAREAAQGHLAAWARSRLGAAQQGLSLRFEVVETSPAAAILEAIENERHDMVVMGTHGRTAARRLLLGSVTESVVRHAPIPVFVVRQKERDFLDPASPGATPRLRRILCPVNRSRAAAAALELAAQLAARFEARLTALRVLDAPPADGGEAARQELCAWIPQGAASQCAVEPKLRHGHPAGEIVRFAEETDQDLIVVGAPGDTTGLARILGETAERVLRHAPCPVLVVPFPAESD
ncbi:MAG: universal stress protein [Verrucomicrobia bacterium]|nr:MAG: universal stress protein [Verrucomicrobiota bacterium]